MKKIVAELFKRSITKEQSKDTGMAHGVYRPQRIRADFDYEVIRPFNQQTQYRNKADPSSWSQKIAFAET
jgi:hypothetical protein